METFCTEGLRHSPSEIEIIYWTSVIGEDVGSQMGNRGPKVARTVSVSVECRFFFFFTTLISRAAADLWMLCSNFFVDFSVGFKEVGSEGKDSKAFPGTTS